MTNDDLLKLLILLAQWELINRGMEAVEIWKIVNAAASGAQIEAEVSG